MANSEPVVIASNQSNLPTNQTQINGVTVATGTGVSGTGVQRVVLASDGNSPVNISQMNGVTVTMGNGTSGTGVQRVTLASDSTGSIASISTSIVPGTGATHLGKAEDAVHTSGDTGVAILSVRRDALNTTSPTSASGDYQTFATDQEGVQWVRPQAVYNSTPPTVTNTNRVDLQANVNGQLLVAQEVTSHFYNVATDIDISVKASAGRLKSIRATNDNAAVRYLLIHNKASAPVGGDAPIAAYPIPAGTPTNPGVIELGKDFFLDNGLVLSTGIAVAISTTAATYTAATVAEHTVAGMYV
jgi:hypothetical protein